MNVYPELFLIEKFRRYQRVMKLWAEGEKPTYDDRKLMDEISKLNHIDVLLRYITHLESTRFATIVQFPSVHPSQKSE